MPPDATTNGAISAMVDVESSRLGAHRARHRAPRVAWAAGRRCPLGGYLFAFAPGLRFLGFQRNVEGTIHTPPKRAAPGTLPSLQSLWTTRSVVPMRSAASAVVMNFAVSRKATASFSPRRPNCQESTRTEGPQ